MARTVTRAFELLQKAVELKEKIDEKWDDLQAQMTKWVNKVRKYLPPTLRTKVDGILGRHVLPIINRLNALSDKAAATILVVESKYKDVVGIANGQPVQINDVVDVLVGNYGQDVNFITTQLESQFGIPTSDAMDIAQSWVDENQGDLMEDIRTSFGIPETP